MPGEPCLIHEYALEPSLLNTWETFRFFEGHFGIETGRLISRYPKRWKKMVYESLGNCSALTKTKIEVALRDSFDPRMMPRHQNAYDFNKSWLANACTEHNTKPFHAIIARENPATHQQVIANDDVNASHPLWVSSPELVVPRTPGAMAAAVAPLLCISRDIYFVDPHFDPRKPRFRAAFGAFIEAATGDGRTVPLQRVEIHTSDEFGSEHFFLPCNQYLMPVIPQGIKVKFVQWKQRENGEKLHNRFILTDIGGVSFRTGLDAMDQGEVGQTDEVSVLRNDVYKTRFDQYCSSSPAFDLVASQEA